MSKIIDSDRISVAEVQTAEESEMFQALLFEEKVKSVVVSVAAIYHALLQGGIYKWRLQKAGEGGSPKASEVGKVSKGGCVKMQTRGRG